MARSLTHLVGTDLVCVKVRIDLEDYSMAGQPERSGGQRTGAGQKPQAFAGGKVRSLPPMEHFDPPSNLSEAEVAVWSELAPYAFEARTLTRQTAMAFVDLCKSRVLCDELERDYGKTIGDTYVEGKRGGPDHRSMIQRVQSQMKDFALSPFGKPVIAEAPKESDPFAKFDVQ